MSDAPLTTMETLLDRIQVEDLLARYYLHFGKPAAHDFASFFTEDGVFDVNGFLFEGREAIIGLYEDLQGGTGAHHGTFHMVMGTPAIAIHGDRATAQFVWTGYLNDTPFAPPRVIEQGREYDLLVKREGRWQIKRRTVISDGGLMQQFAEGYEPRMDFDPLSEA